MKEATTLTKLSNSCMETIQFIIQSFSVLNKVLSPSMSHNCDIFPSLCVGGVGDIFLVSADKDSLCVFGNKNPKTTHQFLCLGQQFLSGS